MRGNPIVRTLIVLLVGLWPFHAGAQYLSVFDVDSWEYPRVRAKFLAFDSSGQRLTNLGPGDFELYEDGVRCSVTDVSCPEDTPREPLSVVLAIDISNGRCQPELWELKKFARAFVEAFPLGDSECAITSFNTRSYLNQDFTTDRQALLTAIDGLSEGGLADLNAALLYPSTGALDVCRQGKGRKVVILITQMFLFGVLQQEIVEKAQQLDVTIFATGPSGEDLPLPELCAQTGGLAESILSFDSRAIYLFFRFLDYVHEQEPCELEWTADGCSTYRRVELRIPERLAAARSAYVITEQRLSNVSRVPAGEVFFRSVEPGRSARREITVTGHVHAFTIDSIVLNHPWYAIADYGGPLPPFVLHPEESRILRLEYTPQDTVDTFCRIELAGDLCGGRLMAAYGAWSNAFVPAVHTVVVHPNGGERLVAGSRTELRWDITDPQHPVRLEYSTDGGSSWMLITERATGERYSWDVPHTPSGSCLLRAIPEPSLIYLGEMVRIPAGSFRMGDRRADPDADLDDVPVHDVTITRPFLMSRTEVTEYQYESIMGENPRGSDESNVAAAWVRWYEAVEYCNRLSELEGLEPCYSGSGDDVVCDFTLNGYRLPTEAEWEYACRAGTEGDFYSGTITHQGSWPLDSALNLAGWYKGNANGHVHPVREKQPNAFGLYDMHGNVWEWCWDHYDPAYYKFSPSTDPVGPATGSSRVLRGGSWNHDAVYSRSSFRSHNIYNNRNEDIGFRIVRTAE